MTGEISLQGLVLPVGGIKELPIDTYQVIISHPKFADQGFFIFGNAKNLDYDFGKIILAPGIEKLAKVW